MSDQTKWSAWVKLGVGLHGRYIEDVTPYDCANKPGYQRAEITLVEPEADPLARARANMQRPDVRRLRH